MIFINSNNVRLLDSLPNDRILCIAYNSSDVEHYCSTNVSFVYINDLKGGEYIVGITHNDLATNDLSVLKALNKYTILSYNSRLLSKYVSSCDLELLHWFYTNEPIPQFVKDNETITAYRKINQSIPNIVNFISILTLIQQCQVVVSYYNLTMSDFEINNSVKYYNDLILSNLIKIEQNGIYTDFNNKLQYGYYSLTTTTGRPSNNYASGNYMSLNKTDGTRSKYVSRFVKGKLVEIDFKSFHPTLIAKLVGYDFQGHNPYTYLAKKYYATNAPTEEQIQQAKQFTFKQMYGSVDPIYSNIEFFKKIIDKVDQLWKQAHAVGYLETPIAKRKMQIKFYEQLNPAKLFNYYIQAFETEYMAGIINKINKVLEGNNTKIILYLYDSVLLDFDYICDSLQVLDDIYNQLNSLNLQYTVKIGTNFNDVKQI